ncbi:hypothetical protein [Arthrobacter sp. C152]
MTLDGPARGVFTQLPRYMAAVAGLTASTVQAGSARGAVAVVPGAGDWWQALVDARAQGAAAVVLARPEMLPRGSFDAGARPGAWPADIPVVVDRPRLRPDVVSDALRAGQGSRARIITVECAATAAALDGVVRDGLGWIRSLVRGPAVFRAGTSTGPNRMALLESPSPNGGSTSATLLGTVLDGPDAGANLKVLALAEVRTEVVVDLAAGPIRVETSTADGTLDSPLRYESSARLALRRAVEAAASGEAVPDFGELLQDMLLAREVADSAETKSER